MILNLSLFYLKYFDFKYDLDMLLFLFVLQNEKDKEEEHVDYTSVAFRREETSTKPSESEFWK